MKNVIRVTGAFLALMILLPASQVLAGCPEVPENKVWGKVSEGALSRYVDAAYKGDWDAYIRTWEKRAEHTRELIGRKSILVFHESKLWLRGDELAAYAQDVEGRIQAMRCLADNDSTQGVSGETLAGSALNGGS
ncbi:MAG: hypothetical protein RH946_01330 [Rhodospirillales bacterium]